MSAITAIALNELRRVGRDRTALFFAFALPIVIIVIIGSTFSNENVLDVGVLDEDGSTRSDALLATLDDTEGLSADRYDSIDTLRRDIRTGTVAAGVVVPAGFGADVDAGESVTVQLIADPTSGSSAAVQATVRAAVADEAGLTAAARFASEHGAGSYDESAATAERLAPDLPEATVRTESIGGDGGRDLGEFGFDYTAPANLVLFVFVNTLVVGAILAADRQQGITRRLLVTPHGTGTILAGIGAAKLLFALAQSALIVVIGGVVFGVDWGDPVGAVLVVLLFALVATAVGLLVGSIVSDVDQAQSVGAPIAIAMGMLGGCMWPLEIVPEAMRVLGHVTPHAWAMDAWVKLVFDGDGVGAIVPQLAVLAGFAAVLGVSAARRLRTALTGPTARRGPVPASA
ncbi:MAG: ABC transporter permease [Acidimicrobiales bacterium]